MAFAFHRDISEEEAFYLKQAAEQGTLACCDKEGRLPGVERRLLQAIQFLPPWIDRQSDDHKDGGAGFYRYSCVRGMEDIYKAHGFVIGISG